MKRSTSPPLRRAHKAIAVVATCTTLFVPSLSFAATTSVYFGFSGGTPVSAAAVVAPPQAGSTVATAPSSVFNTVQKTTELDSTRNTAPTQPAESTPAVAQPVETTPSSTPQQAAPAAPAAKPAPKIGIGVDAVMSDNLKVYTIPVSYAINRNFAVQMNIPVVTAKFDDATGSAATNTGIGDVSLTLKHRIGSEHGLGALFSLVTAKFPSGDADKGLGTGTYDITLTEKVIKRFGDFRGTLMAGVTQPLNKPTILGSSVEYGTTVSYMAAVEHTLVLSDLWFGVRAEGLHSFETKIDGLAQNNALTTLDLAPEFKYYFKKNASANLGVNVPVYTDYAVQGGSTTRQVSASFGVSMLF